MTPGRSRFQSALVRARLGKKDRHEFSVVNRGFDVCLSRVVRTAARLALFALPALPCFPASARYTLIDLGGLFPQDVNDAGHAAGSAGGFAYLYKDGTVVPLGTLGGSYSFAFALNNRDEVAGYSETATGAQKPFLYTQNKMVDILPTAGFGHANGLNDSGVVVGVGEPGAFIYNGGTITLIPATDAEPYAINNHGEVTGDVFRGGLRGFYYSAGVVKEIPLPSATSVQPTAINDRGEIVGFMSSSAFLYEHPFIFSGGEAKELGAFPREVRAWALGINNLGQVVGFFTGTDGGAFIYENGLVTDLNTQVDFPASGISILNSARAISNTGYIVGSGRDRSGAIRGFLLKPHVPQPPPWWAERGVIDPTRVAFDFAAANQGQAKNLAQKAFAELEARLPGGAGPALAQLIASWSNAAAARDYGVLNQGQLKQLAKPFYDRLAEVGYRGPPLPAWQVYPWSASTTDDSDFATANIGQLKHLFSFDLSATTSAEASDRSPD